MCVLCVDVCVCVGYSIAVVVAVCVLWWPMVVYYVAFALKGGIYLCRLYVIGVNSASFSLGAPTSDVYGSFEGSVTGSNRANYGCLWISFNLFSIIFPSDSKA